jgi:hypothetical protein
MKFKGPVFESFKNPPQALDRPPKGHKVLPPGQSWIAHSGRKARLRNLRQSCRSVFESVDPDTVAAVSRIREALSDNEAGMLFIINQAREISESTEASLSEAIMIILDKELKERESNEV